MDSFGLVEGAIYSRRDDIHARFGGSMQSGIAPAPKSGLVLIFTGDEGERYGYSDQWDAEGHTFTYTGHGQEGDMDFLRGNRAVRDHVQDGKALLVFEKVHRSGRYRYIGEMQCAGVTESRGPDANGIDRRIIQFQLVRLRALEAEGTSIEDDADGLGGPSGASLRERAYAAAAPRNEAAKTARRNLYRRSVVVSNYALERAAGSCECCEKPAPFLRMDGSPYLEVHHIERLSDGGLDAPDRVAALCPTCHRRAHYSADRDAMRALLRDRILQLEGKFAVSLSKAEVV